MKYLMIVSVLMLAACGSNPTDRAVSGAVIGGALGAGVGALSGNPRTGLAIGAASGAILGATTTQEDIDLTPRF